MTTPLKKKLWLGKLEGDDDYLHKLVDAYSDPALKITDEPEGIFLNSARFESASSLSDVYEIAGELTGFLNTSAQLFCGRREPINLQGIWSRNNSKHPVFEFYSVNSLSFPLVVYVLDPNTIPPPALYSVWSNNPRIKYVLRIYGSAEQPDWFSLYKLYETVRDDPMLGGSRKGVDAIANWTSVADNERFFETCNWFRHSEHGLSRGRANCKPTAEMSLPEAQRFVGRIVRSWLESYLSGSIGHCVPPNS